MVSQLIYFFIRILVNISISLGKMFPSRGDLHIAPFNDETLYMEQFNKANFW